MIGHRDLKPENVIFNLRERGLLSIALVIAIASGVALEELVMVDHHAPAASPARLGRNLLFAIIAHRWKLSACELGYIFRRDTSTVRYGIGQMQRDYPGLDELEDTNAILRGLPWGPGAVDARTSSQLRQGARPKPSRARGASARGDSTALEGRDVA